MPCQHKYLRTVDIVQALKLLRKSYSKHRMTKYFLFIWVVRQTAVATLQYYSHCIMLQKSMVMWLC